MVEIRSSKRCSGCKQEKTRDEFYQSEQCYVDGLSGYCKRCQRIKSMQSYKAGRQEPKSTRRARAVLTAAGIPCTTGKAAGYAWADLAAWGCIPIEAKGSTITDRNGSLRVLWGFTHKQQHEGFEDGFFVFLAWHKGDQLPMRSFIVPTSEKWTTHHVWSRRYGGRRVGQPKKALGMVIDRLGGELWSKLSVFEDGFDLIEHRRLEIAAHIAGMEDA